MSAESVFSEEERCAIADWHTTIFAVDVPAIESTPRAWLPMFERLLKDHRGALTWDEDEAKFSCHGVSDAFFFEEFGSTPGEAVCRAVLSVSSLGRGEGSYILVSERR